MNYYGLFSDLCLLLSEFGGSIFLENEKRKREGAGLEMGKEEFLERCLNLDYLADNYCNTLHNNNSNFRTKASYGLNA